MCGRSMKPQKFLMVLNMSQIPNISSGLISFKRYLCGLIYAYIREGWYIGQVLGIMFWRTLKKWDFTSGKPKVEQTRNSRLTLNRPRFVESSTAGGADSAPPPCNFPIWRPMTMKFGDVILRQQALPGHNKTFDDIITMTFLWRNIVF